MNGALPAATAWVPPGHEGRGRERVAAARARSRRERIGRVSMTQTSAVRG